MTDKVLVAVPGIGILALDADTYRRALAEGAALVGVPMTSMAAEETALDAEQLAAALNLPVTWLEQAAREKRIPSLQAGRWRRFKRSAVEAALATPGKGARA